MDILYHFIGNSNYLACPAPRFNMDRMTIGPLNLIADCLRLVNIVKVSPVKRPGFKLNTVKRDNHIMPVNIRRTLPRVIILLLLSGMGAQIIVAIPNAYGSGGQWQHIGDEEGVALYRSLNETEGLLPFKAAAELEVPYERIVMALVDAEGKPDWAPKLKATAMTILS